MKENRKLPVLNGHVAESSILSDGTRKHIEPAAVRGRFATARRSVYAALIVVWLLLPVVPIGGHPALFLDIERRRFFVFGSTFAAQDVWLAFFVVTGVAFALVYATALFGRLWCGWVCPQTVFAEVLFRPIERLTKGRSLLLRHLLLVLASVAVAHVFVAYFVSIRAIWSHAEPLAWSLVLSGVFYAHFAFFREQLCVVLCPYGRLQSALLDDASLVIAYDSGRGEPRGKKGRGGDCVDCRRCIAVCPTGIDIRNGLQMDCVACTACIDACDEVMDKLGQRRGLICYVHGGIVRPRTLFYGALLGVGAVVLLFATRARTSFDATLLRQPGAPFVRDENGVHNAFTVHVVNKASSRKACAIEHGSEGYDVPVDRFELDAFTDRRLPLLVTAKPGTKVSVRVRCDREARLLEGVFLGVP